jgi:hypothetical protein
VIVLDGASEPDPTDRNGGWYAEVLGRQIQECLLDRPVHDLAGTLGAAIRHVADQYGLRRGGPSATVSIVRWDTSFIEALVLGDSSVVALNRRGTVVDLVDHRLREVARQERLAFDDLVDAVELHLAWQALVAAEREARNRPGGYWIAETDPKAATEALRGLWQLSDITAVLVVTDGVTVGVDDYGIPATWADAIAVAERDPGELVNLIHDTEASDPNCVKWPRSKRHDDKAVALVQFG